ncbi:MAG: thermonuclease family protein [Anaerolineales bacterium]
MKKKNNNLIQFLTLGCLTSLILCCLAGAGVKLLFPQSPTTTLSPISPTSETNLIQSSVTSLPVTQSLPTNSPTQQIFVPILSAQQDTAFPYPTPELTASQPSSPLYDLYPCLPHHPIQTGIVQKVVDGDTIHVLLEGKEYKLRYIGINAPEDTTKVEAFGQQAMERNQALVSGKTVQLVKDVSEVDRYDRLLRYVFVGTEFVNLILVKEGYAEAVRYPPDTACNATFQEAQSAAQAAHLGLWGFAALTPTIASPTLSTPARCDPAYPTVCIPPPPPDLDCPDITYRNFKVLAPDPHKFDNDHDGIGCEK